MIYLISNKGHKNLKLLISLIIVLLINFNSYCKVLEFEISSSTNAEFNFPHEIIFYVINKNDNSFSNYLEQNLITHLGESGFRITKDPLRANVFLETDISTKNKALEIKLTIKDKKENIFWKASLKDSLKKLEGTKPYITKSIMWTLGKNFSGEVKISKRKNKVLTKYKW